MVDITEGHEYNHGFDRSVCEGCPNKNEGVVDTCGLCGCPLATLEKVRGGSPPSSCPRLPEHAQFRDDRSFLDRLLGL